MDMKVWCKLCERKEFPGDHDLKNVEVRPWLRGFTGPAVPAGGVAVAVKPAPKPVTVAKPRTRKDSEQKIPNNLCPGCDKPLPVSKTKPRRYHNDACRMRASRRK